MKKVVKLLIISALTVACVLGLFACAATPNDSDKQGIICKKLTGDSFYTVIGYNAVEGETSLDVSAAAKANYGESAVVGRIRTGAFDGNNTLTEIIVTDQTEKGDLTIDAGAFKNMRALKSITLPFVGACANSDAFMNQTEPALGDKLKATDKERLVGYVFGEEETEYSSAITMTYGDKSDMTATFYFPVALKEIKIVAQNEINIPMYAFCGLSRITTVTLANNGKIKAIGQSAFKNMTALKSITIPDSVKVIYDNAFEGTSALKSVTFGSGLEEIRSSAFKDCNFTSLNLSETAVKVIGDYAFAGNKYLTSFKFGTTVTGVGAWVFAECDALTELNYTGSMEDCEKITGTVLGLKGSSVTTIKCVESI